MLEALASEFPPGRMGMRGEKEIKVGTIMYRHNEQGYRAPAFTETAPFRMVTLGSEFTYGAGVSAKATFDTLVSTRLAADLGVDGICWNLGIPRTSNDFILKTLASALQVLQPHLVLVVFNNGSRSEFYPTKGPIYRYFPKAPASAIADSFQNLSSPRQAKYDFIKIHLACKQLLDQADVPWLWAAPEEFSAVEAALDMPSRVEWLPNKTVKAKDLHSQLATSFIAKVDLEALQQRVGI